MYHSYEISHGGTLGELGSAVNAKLADGFVPIGGVHINGSVYYQAVAKPLMMSAMLLNTVPVRERKKKKKAKK